MPATVTQTGRRRLNDPPPAQEANAPMQTHPIPTHDARGQRHTVEDRGHSTPCWVWQRHVHANGYGQAYDRVLKKTRQAHVVYWECVNGPVPEGLELDHLCRVRCCVNPEHLEAVTPWENRLRGDSIQAQNARKTHCIHGHPFDEKNTGWSGGRRWCRACMSKRAKRYYRERKAREVLDREGTHAA